MDPLRGRLLAEATRLFVERGFDGVSMQQVADACGVTKAALYYHYAGKAEILGDIVRGYLDDVAGVVAMGRGAGSAAAQLEAIVRGLFALPVESRAVMRLAMHDVRHLADADREAFAGEYRERFVGALAAVVDEGVASGEFAPREPMTVVWLLLGMLYPFFSTHGVDEDAVIDDLLDVLLNGLAARASSVR